MRLGLGIGLQYAGSIGSQGPFSGITVQGAYDSIESAVAGGVGPSGYFVTTIDNVYGLPGFILMQNTPYTAYDSPTAGQAAVGDNTVFTLSIDNSVGYPKGTCIIVEPETAYINDTTAGDGGVAVNQLYALDSPNLGKLIKQRKA